MHRTSSTRFPNVLPSSTNPTATFTRNTIDEHLDMLMVCHHLDPSPDIGLCRIAYPPRNRCRTSCMTSVRSPSSARQPGHGRVGEVIVPGRPPIRCSNNAALPQVSAGNSSFRTKRYIAKYTINPAITGISHEVSSIEVGK
jgi:urease subunit alpha